MTPTREKQIALQKILNKTYPAFQKRKPLAIGTFQKLADLHPEYSKNLIKGVLNYHCQNRHYLVRMLEGNPRFNIEDTTENGIVTEKQAKVALLMLNREYYPPRPKKKKKVTPVDKKPNNEKPAQKAKPAQEEKQAQVTKPQSKPKSVKIQEEKKVVQSKSKAISSKASKPIISVKKKRRVIKKA